MRIGALFTGGKDSTYSLFLASKQNEISCLINANSENKDSYMFHTVGEVLLDKQAEAMGIPLERFRTKGEKEAELNDLKQIIKELKEKYDLEGIVSGAIASEYQFKRINKILDDLGLKSITPLWGIDVYSYLKEFINEGFKAIIVSVSAEGLGKEWLGKELDKNSLEKLKELSEKYRFHLGFEGGEAETAVIDGPNFSKKIEIIKERIIDDEGKYYLDIREAKLIKK